MVCFGDYVLVCFRDYETEFIRLLKPGKMNGRNAVMRWLTQDSASSDSASQMPI
jgi:hypothetical protein